MRKNIVLTLLLLFLSGCSTHVGVKNSYNSNLNHRGDDVPVTVIIYQLENDKRFKEASDLDLIENEDLVLGRDKIDSMKFQIKPGDRTEIIDIDSDEVSYVGILVLYADQTKIKTKSVKKLSDLDNSYLIFRVTSDEVISLDLSRKKAKKERYNG